jgi:hypothetical protein
MFKEGDRVRLSAMGRKKYRDTLYNPHNEVGVVEENYNPMDYYMSCNVRWLLFWKYYREEELELAHPSISLEEMLKECLG